MMERTWLRAKFERSVFWLRYYIFGEEYANWFDPFNTWNRGYMARVEKEIMMKNEEAEAYLSAEEERLSAIEHLLPDELKSLEKALELKRKELYEFIIGEK